MSGQLHNELLCQTGRSGWGSEKTRTSQAFMISAARPDERIWQPSDRTCPEPVDLGANGVPDPVMGRFLSGPGEPVHLRFTALAARPQPVDRVVGDSTLGVSVGVLVI